MFKSWLLVETTTCDAVKNEKFSYDFEIEFEFWASSLVRGELRELRIQNWQMFYSPHDFLLLVLPFFVLDFLYFVFRSSRLHTRWLCLLFTHMFSALAVLTNERDDRRRLEIEKDVRWTSGVKWNLKFLSLILLRLCVAFRSISHLGFWVRRDVV